MYVKYAGEGGCPLVGGQVIYKNTSNNVKDLEPIKEFIEEGYEFVIKVEGTWVDAEKYFESTQENKEKVESVTETHEINVVEDEKIPYEELFSGHWTHQAKNIEEYTDDISTLDNIIEWAENNEVSQGVIKRVKDYRDSLI